LTIVKFEKDLKLERQSRDFQTYGGAEEKYGVQKEIR